MTPDERTVLSALELLDTGTEQPIRVWAFKRILDRVEGLRAETERMNKELSDALWSNVSLCKEINNKDEQIGLRDEAITRLEAEFDATCNAEELRQVREDNKRLKAEVARLREAHEQDRHEIGKLHSVRDRLSARIAELEEGLRDALADCGFSMKTKLHARLMALLGEGE